MIYLCDFEDSFTYNIFSTLKSAYPELSIDVIPKNRVLAFLQKVESLEDKSVIILGPGPGHPDDYAYLIQAINKMTKLDNVLIYGICLGHQLIWKSLGAKIEHCHRPIHGQSKTYDLPLSLSETLDLAHSIQVQHYNSLAVKPNEASIKSFQGELFIHNDELIISVNQRIITYQFHPESVGTTFPESFFRSINKFLL